MPGVGLRPIAPIMRLACFLFVPHRRLCCDSVLTNSETKPFLALEEACQECRYRTPRRSFLRFALASLRSLSRSDRGPCDSFWLAMGQPHSPWSHAVADMALTAIYQALRNERPDTVSWAMWKRRFEEEGGGGKQ